MKNYILYILILVAFFLGQFLGTQDKSGEELLTRKFEQEQKAIMQALAQKQAEVVRLNEASKAQEQKIAKLEKAVQEGDKKVQSIETHYRKKLATVTKYTPVQRDSFFYAKYPGQDTIRSVDSRKIMQDLVRGEGQDSVNTALKVQVVTLKAVVVEQKEQIKTEQQKIEKERESKEAFEGLAKSNGEERDYYQGKYRKQKGQKGILTIGIGLLIGLLVIK